MSPDFSSSLLEHNILSHCHSIYWIIYSSYTIVYVCVRVRERQRASHSMFYACGFLLWGFLILSPQPLMQRKQEHEKKRKEIKELWLKAKRKLVRTLSFCCILWDPQWVDTTEVRIQVTDYDVLQSLWVMSHYESCLGSHMIHFTKITC